MEIHHHSLPLKKLFDDDCLDSSDFDINRAIFWYIVANYSKHELGEDLISDAVYNRLCTRIKNNWEKLECREKKYVDFTHKGLTLIEYPDNINKMITLLKECYNE